MVAVVVILSSSSYYNIGVYVPIYIYIVARKAVCYC